MNLNTKKSIFIITHSYYTYKYILYIIQTYMRYSTVSGSWKVKKNNTLTYKPRFNN